MILGDSELHQAQWWIPGDTKRVGGVLELGSSFELRLTDTISDGSVPITSPGRLVILGRNVKHEFTLLDCDGWESGAPLGGFHAIETEYRCPTVLIGKHHLETTADVAFDRVEIRLVNLDGWADRRPFAWDPEPLGFSYNDPEAIRADVPGGYVELRRVAHWRESQHEPLIESHEVLRFFLNTALSISVIDHTYVRPIRQLFNLATGGPCDILSMRLANSSRPNSVGGEDWLEVKRYRGKRPRPPRKSTTHHFMPFSLHTINFTELLPHWFSLSEVISLTGDIIFSLDDNEFVGNRMLNSAASVEGLHRRLNPKLDKETPEQRNRRKAIEAAVPEEYREWFKDKFINPHRPEYAERLAALIDLAGQAARPFVGPNRNAWVKLVKKYRNDSAHSSAGSENSTVLFLLSSAVEALLRIALWRKLGFTEEECVKMAGRDRRWESLKDALVRELPELYVVVPAEAELESTEAEG